VALGRRDFLKLSGGAAIASCLEPLTGAGASTGLSPDSTPVVRIRKALVELAPGRCITTTTFNGQLPGPLLRGAVGRRMRLDICNETDTPERVNWLGQEVAGAGAAILQAHSTRRVEFTPTRPGLYLYHSDSIAAARLDTGLYSGQAGALLIEGNPSQQQGGWGGDPEYVVVLKEYEPYLYRTARGYDVGYESVTINGRLVGERAALDVNTGERMLLQVLNASATNAHTLELPGRSFEVLTLDGNPVPTPVAVKKLWLAPGERVGARVRMSPLWEVGRRATEVWDYTRFGDGRAPSPDADLELVLSRHEAARSGFNHWSVNGESFSVDRPRPLLRLRQGLRYRLTIRNTSDELIPLHLQRHQLQITCVEGRATAGVLKDVICVAPRQRVQVDFVADNPGRALLYCTRQLHRDFGLMALFDYT
jgi:FtsP/CotA-like multicopper oxidase with cupredoxin domain